MKAADFDKAFDDGADIDALVDWTSSKRRASKIRLRHHEPDDRKHGEERGEAGREP